MDGLLEQRTPLVTHGPEPGPTVPVPVPLLVRLPVPLPAKPPDAGGRWRRVRRKALALTGFGMVFLTSMVASYVLQRDRPPSGSLASGQWSQPAPATPERSMLAGMGSSPLRLWEAPPGWSGPGAAPTKPAQPAPGPSRGTGYRVQVAAVLTEDVAKAEWVRLRRRYPDELGALDAAVVRADLGARGIVYRIQAGPLERTRARDLCARLQMRNAGCLTVRE